MSKKWLIILSIAGAVLLSCVGGFLFLSMGLYRIFGAQDTPWPVSLHEARSEHETQLWKQEDFGERLLPRITHSELEYTSYEGPLGRMGAIASREVSGLSKPAIIWDFGGFGGIFDGYADEHPANNDQSIRQFLDRGFVVFLPAVRGEHGNPGVFECFYGEVDDLVAAVEHVAARSDVDPERIYLMGHSTGGTNVLLASAMTDIPAGVVSFGGAPDMAHIVSGGGYGVEPYSMASEVEVALRSPNRFTKYIQCPVLYIEGSAHDSSAARAMERRAVGFGVDLRVVIVDGADHWTVLQPVKGLLADHIGSGKSGLPSSRAIQRAFNAAAKP